MRRLALLVALLGLAGCETGFRLETLIEDLRLIGMQAEPAVLRPGEATRLSALVLDPTRAQPPTVLWIGCTPDPYNLNRSPCANPDVLGDPGALTGGTGALPPGVSVIGFNDNASYAVPAGLFDVLPPEDPRRGTGTVGQIVAFAVAETLSPAASEAELRALFERVQRKEVKSIIALFRVTVAEAPEPNANPVIDALVVAGERWPAGARLMLLPGEPVTVDLAAPESTFEPYTRQTPSGPEARVERVQIAWYSTSGSFFTETTALGEPVKNLFTAPGLDPKHPLPERRTGTLHTVHRDSRGGQSWRAWPFFVCDADAPTPRVTSVEWPTGAGGEVTLRGEQLEALLDVVVDGVALEAGAYSPLTGSWRGVLPGGVEPGARRGTLHTQGCRRLPL